MHWTISTLRLFYQSILSALTLICDELRTSPLVESRVTRHHPRLCFPDICDQHLLSRSLSDAAYRRHSRFLALLNDLTGEFSRSPPVRPCTRPQHLHRRHNHVDPTSQASVRRQCGGPFPAPNYLFLYPAVIIRCRCRPQRAEPSSPSQCPVEPHDRRHAGSQSHVGPQR